jgi:Myb-like DNA-binding domain
MEPLNGDPDPRDQQIEWLSRRLAALELKLWSAQQDPGYQGSTSSAASDDSDASRPRGGPPTPTSQGLWEEESHARFLRGVSQFGGDWRRIAELIPYKPFEEVEAYGIEYLRRTPPEAERKSADPPTRVFQRGKRASSSESGDSTDGGAIPKRSRSDEIPGTGFISARNHHAQHTATRRSRRNHRTRRSFSDEDASLGRFPSIAEVTESGAKTPRTVNREALEDVFSNYYEQVALQHLLREQIAAQKANTGPPSKSSDLSILRQLAQVQQLLDQQRRQQALQRQSLGFQPKLADPGLTPRADHGELGDEYNNVLFQRLLSQELNSGTPSGPWHGSDDTTGSSSRGGMSETLELQAGQSLDLNQALAQAQQAQAQAQALAQARAQAQAQAQAHAYAQAQAQAHAQAQAQVQASDGSQAHLLTQAQAQARVLAMAHALAQDQGREVQMDSQVPHASGSIGLVPDITGLLPDFAALRNSSDLDDPSGSRSVTGVTLTPVGGDEELALEVAAMLNNPFDFPLDEEGLG